MKTFDTIEQLLNQGAGHIKSFSVKRYNEENGQNHWRLTFYDPIKEFDADTLEEVVKMGEDFLADTYLQINNIK